MFRTQSLLVVAIALAGCASTSENKLAAGSKQANSEYDLVYISRVQAESRQRGVVVKWVNPPKAADRQGRHPK